MSNIRSEVLSWFATGSVGASSKAMALAACDLPCSNDYPRDPDDLNRCLLMLRDVPEVRNHFDKISALGVVWERLISQWDEIEKSFIDEAGLNWEKSRSAPKTYALMKHVRGEEPGVIRIGNVSFRSQ